MTTIFDPRVVSDNRNPCKAILPRTVNAASFSGVPSGILEHKFFHTIFGVSIVAIVCATLGKSVCEFGLRIWNKILKMENIKWFKTEIKINNFSSWIGAITGALSQLILDSIMHRDMTPLFPFSKQNIFLRIVSIENLHYICLALFVTGVVIYLLKKVFFK